MYGDAAAESSTSCEEVLRRSEVGVVVRFLVGCPTRLVRSSLHSHFLPLQDICIKSQDAWFFLGAKPEFWSGDRVER